MNLLPGRNERDAFEYFRHPQCRKPVWHKGGAVRGQAGDRIRIKTSEPLIMAQTAGSTGPAEETLLQQMERNIFQWEMLQTHYVNSTSI